MSEYGNKALAWEALKNTRNPEFVAIKYGFPVDDLRKALEKLPHEKPMFRRLVEDSVTPRRPSFKRPGELLPETLQRETVPREPGCDDDL